MDDPIYRILTDTHRSNQDDDTPIIEDHYDRVNLTNAIRANSVVSTQSLLDFVQASYDTANDLAELLNDGRPLNDKQMGILRAGFQKTWGDSLGVLINEYGRVERQR